MDQRGSDARGGGAEALLAENAALRAAARRLQAAAEGTGLGWYEIDLSTGEGLWSRSAFALIGAPAPSDLKGTFDLWRSALHPDDRDAVLAAHDAAAASGGAWQIAFRVRRLGDGEVRWLSVFGRFTSDAGTTFSTGIAIDVTEQRAAREALADSEARLRTLTNNFPAGAVYQIAVGPAEGERRFLYVSDSVEQFGGLTAAELLADASLAYRQLEPECIPQVMAAEAASMRDHSMFDEEVRFVRRDGARRWARIVSMPRRQADGSWVWDGIQLDITDQKEAERQLRELNATLEERVQQRAEELAQTQQALRQSQKLESLGQLTGGVAHDFNNLLSPIIGGLDMLQRRGVGDARAARTIAAALESAERARTLVQRLLAFARRQPLQPQPVSVVALVRGMASLLESTLGSRVRLVLDLPEQLSLAHGDPNQLEMALLNLVLNARDAMPDGGALAIAASEWADMVSLTVTDTGHGMDEATLARAVEPFFSTKEVGQGTGLGLSMVHGLAAQLGGELLLRSAPGQGTQVELRLPLAGPAPAPSVGSPQDPEPCARGRVLVVDDEPAVLASTAEMLRELGFEVVEAGSGEAALARIRAGERPDLLVTDHMMPELTGADLIAAARGLRANLPVLLISGYADAAHIGADVPRLAKPFRVGELGAAVRLAMTAAPAPAAAAG